jgi:hypothetical protein
MFQFKEKYDDFPVTLPPIRKYSDYDEYDFEVDIDDDDQDYDFYEHVNEGDFVPDDGDDINASTEEIAT